MHASRRRGIGAHESRAEDEKKSNDRKRHRIKQLIQATVRVARCIRNTMHPVAVIECSRLRASYYDAKRRTTECQTVHKFATETPTRCSLASTKNGPADEDVLLRSFTCKQPVYSGPIPIIHRVDVAVKKKTRKLFVTWEVSYAARASFNTGFVPEIVGSSSEVEAGESTRFVDVDRPCSRGNQQRSKPKPGIITGSRKPMSFGHLRFRCEAQRGEMAPFAGGCSGYREAARSHGFQSSFARLWETAREIC